MYINTTSRCWKRPMSSNSYRPHGSPLACRSKGKLEVEPCGWDEWLDNGLFQHREVVYICTPDYITKSPNIRIVPLDSRSGLYYIESGSGLYYKESGPSGLCYSCPEVCCPNEAASWTESLLLAGLNSPSFRMALMDFEIFHRRVGDLLGRLCRRGGFRLGWSCDSWRCCWLAPDV